MAPCDSNGSNPQPHHNHTEAYHRETGVEIHRTLGQRSARAWREQQKRADQHEEYADECSQIAHIF